MVRVTVGVEAHTHEFIATAHEDQKFGFSLAGGAAVRGGRLRILDDGVLELRGLHSHIGSQIFDTTGFEVSARRVLGAAGADPRRARRGAARAGPRRRLRHRVHHPGRPGRAAATWPSGCARSSRTSARRARLAVPHLSVEPGRAIVGPAMFTLYEVGTVKDVDGIRTYVSVDGGMSDNIRTALYDASYSATLASPGLDAPTPMLARVVGKHCEAGDIVVKDEFLPADVQPGDLLAVPGTGAYCRSMASNYNHVPRPPVVAVRDGAARVIVRRETEEDLLALDVG